MEKRRHQRVNVSLLGRYMLSDRHEYPCQTVNISPGGLAMIAPVMGELGERVIVYLDHLGRIEGAIVRPFPNGFAMTITATARKRDKLATQLIWLANRHELNLPEDRRHERVAPRNNRSILTLPDGSDHPCIVIDISLSGAAIQTSLKLPLGTAVVLGKTQARVVRHIENGLAVEFVRPQTIESLQEQFT
ncbi:pilus assembly protein PilZ [Agaricicola taiwanensis]|uniref:Pilus assembly protein PilZ n=2 Tax=Agaricicola taiwanensis TaxID=591372 RepID=A0A8J3DXE4_9RHOB|nr:pilus assembly protein PilZ [Agaricicola taiwanensis]